MDKRLDNGSTPRLPFLSHWLHRSGELMIAWKIILIPTWYFECVLVFRDTIAVDFTWVRFNNVTLSLIF